MMLSGGSASVTGRRGSGFFDVEDLAATIGTALLADVVPLLPGSTGFAAHQGNVELDAIVGAPLISAGLTGFSFRDGHGLDTP